MKRKGTGKGIMAIGSLRTDGITTYMKQGRLIIRSANSMERRSNTCPSLYSVRRCAIPWRCGGC